MIVSNLAEHGQDQNVSIKEELVFSNKTIHSLISPPNVSHKADAHGMHLLKFAPALLQNNRILTQKRQKGRLARQIKSAPGMGIHVFVQASKVFREQKQTAIYSNKFWTLF